MVVVVVVVMFGLMALVSWLLVDSRIACTTPPIRANQVQYRIWFQCVRGSEKNKTLRFSVKPHDK